MADLLDASVWLPLSAPDHEHYPRARTYWDTESADEMLFCRSTALALLQYLTNQRILQHAVLDAAAAWRALETWLAVPQISFVTEPAGVDELLRDWASKLDLRAGGWTDAYLAAFASAGDYRLVAFDAGFRRFPGLKFLHLHL